MYSFRHSIPELASIRKKLAFCLGFSFPDTYKGFFSSFHSNGETEKPTFDSSSRVSSFLLSQAILGGT
jgi:hypothetical protein